MNLKLITAAAFAATALYGCGGGGSDSGTVDAPVKSSLAASFNATAGATWFYEESITTDGNSSLNMPVRYVRGSSNPDGSYTVVRSDTNNVVHVLKTPYGSTQATEYYDRAGRPTRTVQQSATSAQDCTFATAPTRAPYPLYQDSTWSGDWSAVCNPAGTTTHHLRNGHVVGVEPLTVPAGTFQAVHMAEEHEDQSTFVAFTLHVSQDMWIDTATGIRLQTIRKFVYQGGAPAAGYPTQIVSKLQSYKPGV